MPVAETQPSARKSSRVSDTLVPVLDLFGACPARERERANRPDDGSTALVFLNYLPRETRPLLFGPFAKTCPVASDPETRRTVRRAQPAPLLSYGRRATTSRRCSRLRAAAAAADDARRVAHRDVWDFGGAADSAPTDYPLINRDCSGQTASNDTRLNSPPSIGVADVRPR